MSTGGVIGCGGPMGSGGAHVWRGETYETITNGEVWLRAYCSTNLFDTVTTQSVLTHELGHTLGLGHSDQGVSPHDGCAGDESAATMRSNVQHRTTLGMDDADAARWLYGDGGNSCSSGGPMLTVTKSGGGSGTVTGAPRASPAARPVPPLPPVLPAERSSRCRLSRRPPRCSPAGAGTPIVPMAS